MMLSIWLMFVLNPIVNYVFYKDPNERPNISANLEKQYTDDWRFLIPLYLYVIVDTITHIWALCVVSTTINIESILFENKLDNCVRWIAFIFVWGYSCGIGGLAAHELIHKNSLIHKFIGTF